jgi:hypothetical protein
MCTRSHTRSHTRATLTLTHEYTLTHTRHTLTHARHTLTVALCALLTFSFLISDVRHFMKFVVGTTTTTLCTTTTTLCTIINHNHSVHNHQHSTTITNRQESGSTTLSTYHVPPRTSRCFASTAYLLSLSSSRRLQRTAPLKPDASRKCRQAYGRWLGSLNNLGPKCTLKHFCYYTRALVFSRCIYTARPLQPASTQGGVRPRSTAKQPLVV